MKNPSTSTGDTEQPRQKRIAEEVMSKNAASALRCTIRTSDVAVLKGWLGNGVVQDLQWLIDNGYLTCNESGTKVWRTQKTVEEIQL